MALGRRLAHFSQSINALRLEEIAKSGRQFEPADTPPIFNALRGECHKCCHTTENSDEELAEVVRGWPRLAGPLRAAVLAIVRSQNGATEGEQP